MAAAVEEVLGPRLADEKQLAGWINVPADCVRPLKWIHLHAARPAGVNEPTAAGAAGATRNPAAGRIARAGRPVPLPALRRRLGPAAGAGRTASRWKTSWPSRGTSAPPARTSSSSIRSASNSAGSKAEDWPGRAVRGDSFRSIISDVLGDPLDLIASGPTVEDRSSPGGRPGRARAFAARRPGIPAGRLRVAPAAAASAADGNRPTAR